MQRINKAWRLARHPEGAFRPGDLVLSEERLPPLREGELLIRTIYFTIDPTHRIYASEIDQYMTPVALGEVMRSTQLGVVEESRHAGFAPGDIVWGLGAYQLYTISRGEMIRRVEPVPGLPLIAHMTVLYAPLIAYFGVLDVARPRPGETMVISTAAGATGSAAVQIAKMQGARVIGLAGSDEKCAWVRDALGADAAINYKSENVIEALRRHCPDGIDVYFDNVGGEILDAALTLMSVKGRITICGLMSMYNSFDAKTRVPGPFMFRNVLMKRLKVEGVLILDYMDRLADASAQIKEWALAGKLKWKVDVMEGIEQAPHALDRLFSGANTGKLLIRASPEP